MSSENKQIYIPSIFIKGAFIEEVGGGAEKVTYPGNAFETCLSSEDFESSEDYHNTWINITRAVKHKLNKLNKNADASS
jgi:hypothetical protein